MYLSHPHTGSEPNDEAGTHFPLPTQPTISHSWPVGQLGFWSLQSAFGPASSPGGGGGGGSVVVVVVGDVVVVVVVGTGPPSLPEEAPDLSNKSPGVAPLHAATTRETATRAGSGRVFTSKAYFAGRPKANASPRAWNRGPPAQPRNRMGFREKMRPGDEPRRSEADGIEVGARAFATSPLRSAGTPMPSRAFAAARSRKGCRLHRAPVSASSASSCRRPTSRALRRPSWEEGGRTRAPARRRSSRRARRPHCRWPGPD